MVTTSRPAVTRRGSTEQRPYWSLYKFSQGDIRLPIYYLGAAGGFSDYGVHSARVTRATDVTTPVVRHLPPELEADDYGHADLLFARDAPELAWQPLATWLARQ